MRKRNLILIGFMGSGKTSVGIKLSYRLRVPVEDTDKLIERREGCTVSDIFRDKGEAYFRQLETELLRELVESKAAKIYPVSGGTPAYPERIYSVGGGTPVCPENRTLLKRLGGVVYLRVGPETVYERLKGDAARPLLQCGNPLEKIRELMQARKAAYEETADMILDVDGMTLDQIQESILMKMVSEW